MLSARSKAVDRAFDLSRKVARIARSAALGCDNRPAEQLGSGGEQRRRLLARIHPRPGALANELDSGPRDLERDCRLDTLQRGEAVGAEVAHKLASAGYDVDRFAAAQSRRHSRQSLRALWIAQRVDQLRRLGKREQRADTLLGRASAVCGAAVSDQPERAGSFALDDDGIVTVCAPLASLEAEAGVEAGEARPVGELSAAPLLIVDEQ
ncbi:unannotated protein [freshwater metagenome]|uniref:Unannotated protein n=1 Tax=freshwater metagenome TaxID=449393 RepID=A0A6J7RLK2_9ZZZZ